MGFCRPGGLIALNWRTFQASLPIIDYVVVHEPIHRCHRDYCTREFTHWAELVGPQKWSAIHELQQGDLMGYYERNRAVHFAIVAGFDPDGYPL